MNRTRYRYGILGAILIILHFWGCASIQNQWREASSVNTIGAYEDFLARNPRSEYSTEARSRLAKLSFDQARRSDSIVAYQEFLNKYKDTPSATEARERLATLVFEECKKENTVQSYMAFVQKHKGTHAAAEASARLDSLVDWSDVKKLVHGTLTSDQKSIKLEGLSSSYPDLKGLKWFGPIPEISTWLGLRLQDVEESFSINQVMAFYSGTPNLKAKYPKGIITLPSGPSVEIYSHPADPLEFSWGHLAGRFVEGKGWEFGPFKDADILKWNTGRGIVVLKKEGETNGFLFGVK